MEKTLAREVLEETAYTVNNSQLLGFMHFHHLGPEPAECSYPHPDFFQLVYAARAGQHRLEDVVTDEYVRRSELMPVDQLLSLGLPQGEYAYLQAARRL